MQGVTFCPRNGSVMCTAPYSKVCFIIIIIIIIIIINYDVLTRFGFCRLSVLPKLCAWVQWLTHGIAEKSKIFVCELT
jgi:hypothetical protein